MKTITFLLPNSNSHRPIGGLKVVYEYANRLVNDGFIVNIIYPRHTPLIGKDIKTFFKNLYIKINALLKSRKVKTNFKEKSWFQLDSRVNEISTWDYSEKNVPKSDIYIATMYNTAIALDKYRTKAEKYYLIQCFENFFISDEEFLSTLKLDLKNIAICEWLGNYCIQMGNPAKILYNGFDFEYFRLITPIEDRNPFHFSMMYNPDPWKGFNEAFEAVKICKNKYPEIKVSIFGRDERPNFLPNWVNYFQKPNQEEHNEIYNNSSIFIIGSHNEGWGLPVGEAMQCGCAIVGTDIGGFRPMCIPNETALLSPVSDIDKMVENIEFILKKPNERIRLAKNANNHIQSFTWDKSYSKLKSIIFEN
ncbi:glycosyltransferase [Ornithobacterium rhinotracheale]|uniref:glycosyltransferase family 4 protein n=1 Tax=Ornithobacterium rhinotracheale TaxID=28251 RepID=UPI00129C9F30|nr:glycosyltransferase family 4 protein [Ornithobacterium rhinotracheale]MRI62413.1 glycosyltransferase [Ornithobacterium rhinotracheale]